MFALARPSALQGEGAFSVVLWATSLSPAPCGMCLIAPLQPQVSFACSPLPALPAQAGEPPHAWCLPELTWGVASRGCSSCHGNSRLWLCRGAGNKAGKESCYWNDQRMFPVAQPHVDPAATRQLALTHYFISCVPSHPPSSSAWPSTLLISGISQEKKESKQSVCRALGWFCKSSWPVIHTCGFSIT